MTTPLKEDDLIMDELGSYYLILVLIPLLRLHTMKRMFISHSNVMEAFSNFTAKERKQHFKMVNTVGKD